MMDAIPKAELDRLIELANAPNVDNNRQAILECVENLRIIWRKLQKTQSKERLQEAFPLSAAQQIQEVKTKLQLTAATDPTQGDHKKPTTMEEEVRETHWEDEDEDGDGPDQEDWDEGDWSGVDELPVNQDDWDAEDYEDCFGADEDDDRIAYWELQQEEREREEEESRIEDDLKEHALLMQDEREDIENLSKQFDSLIAQGMTKDQAWQIIVGEEENSPTSEEAVKEGVAKGHGAAPFAWYYDDSAYYSYVLLNAEDAQLDAVKNALREKKLCQFGGRSYRPADNGAKFRWFIRIRATPSQELDRNALREQVASVLSALPGSAVYVAPSPTEHEKPTTEQSRAAEALRKQLEEAKLHLDQSLQEIENLKTKALHLQSTTDQYKQLLTAARSEADAINAGAKELLIRVTNEEGQSGEPIAMLKGVIENLRTQLESKTAENVALEAIWQEVEEKRASLEESLARVAREKEEQKATILELQRISTQARNMEPKPTDTPIRKENHDEDVVKRVLAGAFPNITFLPGSIDVLFKEFSDPKSTLKKLSRLANNAADLKVTENVKCAPGWRECHCSTGRDDAGRLYFLKSSKASKYFVLISHKGLQKRDFRFLGSFAE
jgi:hypothetical protein